MLLGTNWSDNIPRVFDGPSGALTFFTRQGCREWCQAERARYRGRNDSCSKWRFIPVRVRETVAPI